MSLWQDVDQPHPNKQFKNDQIMEIMHLSLVCRIKCFVVFLMALYVPNSNPAKVDFVLHPFVVSKISTR